MKKILIMITLVAIVAAAFSQSPTPSPTPIQLTVAPTPPPMVSQIIRLDPVVVPAERAQKLTQAVVDAHVLALPAGVSILQLRSVIIMPHADGSVTLSLMISGTSAQ